MNMMKPAAGCPSTLYDLEYDRTPRRFLAGPELGRPARKPHTYRATTSPGAHNFGFSDTNHSAASLASSLRLLADRLVGILATSRAALVADRLEAIGGCPGRRRAGRRYVLRWCHIVEVTLAPDNKGQFWVSK